MIALGKPQAVKPEEVPAEIKVNQVRKTEFPRMIKRISSTKDISAQSLSSVDGKNTCNAAYSKLIKALCYQVQASLQNSNTLVMWLLQ